MVGRDEIQPPFGVQELELEGVETFTPYLEIKVGEETIPLHHFNVLVRLFETESANHVELRDKSGCKGIRMAQEILQQMVDYDYSFRWDRYVDENTLEWLSAIEASHLDEELDSLDG